MTTETLAPNARLNVALFSAGANMPGKPKFRFEKRKFEGATQDTDVLVVEDLPVFRSGSFRDSMGFQHTWESIHMDQMVAHFDLLKSRHIFEDVPIRAGHPSFLSNNLHDVIGYHTGLRSETRTNPVDGTEELYLLATFEVMDPGAIEKISSGLWRNVSAEVGSFLSNNETEFWPVYQGVAYVDVPAVEGLKSFNNHNGVGKTFSIMLDTDKEATAVGTETPTNTPAQAPVVQTPTDTAYHGRANFTFSIAGQQTNDFAKVQAHITNIEAQNATFAAAASEAKLANRKAFIKGLAEGATPKILASQIPSIEGYALGMDDEAWGHFQKAHEDMPPMSSVSQHSNATQGGQEVNPTGLQPAGGTPPVDSALETTLGIFEMHRRSGMKVEALKATESYNKLRAANPTDPEMAARVTKALEGIPA